MSPGCFGISMLALPWRNRGRANQNHHAQVTSDSLGVEERHRVDPAEVTEASLEPGAVGAQLMPNGAMVRQEPMVAGSMNNFPHGPSGIAGNPGMTLPLSAPLMGDVMPPGIGSQQGNMTMGDRQNMAPGLLGANIPDGGLPTSGEPVINPGQAPLGASSPQHNRVTQNEQPTNMMPPPSPAGGSPNEQPNGTSHVDGSPQNQPSDLPQPGAQWSPSASNTQGSTAPPTPNGTNSSLTASSPSGINGTSTTSPAIQPTSNALPDVPSNFLTNDFMQSVATTLEDFDPQILFRQDEAGINFEQDFREWFNPDDQWFPPASNVQGSTAPPASNGTNSSFTASSPSGVNGTLHPQVSFRQDDSINFERDFREWFGPDAQLPPSASNTQGGTAPSPSGVNGTPHSQVPFRQDDSINFEQDFREWFGPEAQRPPSASITTQGNTAPPTLNGTNSSFTAPSPSGVNGTLHPQVLFRQDDSINFEQDFREWFNPDDMESMRND